MYLYTPQTSSSSPQTSNDSSNMVASQLSSSTVYECSNYLYAPPIYCSLISARLGDDVIWSAVHEWWWITPLWLAARPPSRLRSHLVGVARDQQLPPGPRAPCMCPLSWAEPNLRGERGKVGNHAYTRICSTATYVTCNLKYRPTGSNSRFPNCVRREHHQPADSRFSLSSRLTATWATWILQSDWTAIFLQLEQIRVYAWFPTFPLSPRRLGSAQLVSPFLVEWDCAWIVSS